MSTSRREDETESQWAFRMLAEAMDRSAALGFRRIFDEELARRISEEELRKANDEAIKASCREAPFYIFGREPL